MEERDNELTESLAHCRQQKGEILKKINDIHKNLKEKKVAIDDIKCQEDNLLAKFHELCPPGSQFYDDLLGIYKKIVKRKNVQLRNNDDEGEDEDDYEDDEEDDEDDEDMNPH